LNATGPFFSNASKAPRVAPGRLPCAIGVVASLASPSPIGIAYEVGRVGEFDWDTDEDLGPREAIWRLVVGKEDVEGRFVLRGGVFVGLAEDARNDATPARGRGRWLRVAWCRSVIIPGRPGGSWSA
jgi:hypothetical protein